MALKNQSYVDSEGDKSDLTEVAECKICNLVFTPFDSVVICAKSHIFHSDCFDEYFTKKSLDTFNERVELKCPVCGTRMDTSEYSETIDDLDTESKVKLIDEIASSVLSSSKGL